MLRPASLPRAPGEPGVYELRLMPSFAGPHEIHVEAPAPGPPPPHDLAAGSPFGIAGSTLCPPSARTVAGARQRARGAAASRRARVGVRSAAERAAAPDVGGRRRGDGAAALPGARMVGGNVAMLDITAMRASCAALGVRPPPPREA